jgi:hypothetical protein
LDAEISRTISLRDTAYNEEMCSALEAKFGKLVARSPQPQIILGTQSASRRAVVDQLATRFGFKYSSITADIDEKAIRREDPEELVLALSHAKAAAIVKKLKDSESLIRPGYLVTCDQVCNYHSVFAIWWPEHTIYC